MKTNYLFFKQRGSQSYTYSAGAQTFTLADAGTGNFDEDIANDLRIRVNVTFKEDQTTKCGSAYSGGSVDAGETVTVNANGKSITGAVVTIAAQTADGTNGITLSAGDIVTITQIPAEGTEVAFKADRLLGVRTTNDTTTVISFKAGDDESFATTNDAVTLTHNSNANAARLIASAMEEAVNSETGTGFVDVLDREAATGVLTKTGLSFTNLQLSIQA